MIYMITFEDIINTNKQLGKTQKLIDIIKKTASAYSYEDNLNRSIMRNLNKLIGKYFTEKTKAYVHKYYDKQGIEKGTLQISKAGIGKTNAWNTNITPFYNIIRDENEEDYYYRGGIIDTVINDNIVFKKCLSHLSDNGKYILNSLKDAYKNNKIKDPDNSTITTKIILSSEEAHIFKKKELLIYMSDDSDVNLHITNEKSQNNYEDNCIFTLNILDLEDEKDFIYNLFVNSHAEEIEKAINDYTKKTNENLVTWKKFNEELTEKLAKYLVLMKLDQKTKC